MDVLGIEWVRWTFTGILSLFAITWTAIGHIYVLRDKDRREREMEQATAVSILNERITEFQKIVEADRREAWLQREIIASKMGKMVTTDDLDRQADRLMSEIRNKRS